jgi:hypothetical protein
MMLNIWLGSAGEGIVLIYYFSWPTPFLIAQKIGEYPNNKEMPS